jgi:hypothetical protein
VVTLKPGSNLNQVKRQIALAICRQRVLARNVPYALVALICVEEKN